MKVCISGTRDDEELAGLAADYVRHLPITDCVVTGGSGRVDQLAEIAAHTRGVDCVVFNAGWTAHGSAAGPIRNARMAEYADRLVAFWKGTSPGTGNCIQEFKKRGKPVMIIHAAHQAANWRTLTDAEATESRQPGREAGR